MSAVRIPTFNLFRSLMAYINIYVRETVTHWDNQHSQIRETQIASTDRADITYRNKLTRSFLLFFLLLAGRSEFEI